MGPHTKAALVASQKADTAFKSALLEELMGIREAMNHMAGRHALDEESLEQRIEALEKRVSKDERLGSSG